jgi:diguanylate cyclase (GGDEF)-like protein
VAKVDNEHESDATTTSISPLIIHDDEKCTECWGCVRHCPARAIKVVDGRSQIIEERCVKCGQCVTECGHSGHGVRDDLPAVRALLAADKAVIALMASEYIAALHPLTPDQVERHLVAAGFSALETTVLGEELIAAAYEQALKTAAPDSPQLRSTCPVTAEWVRRFYPELTGMLAEIVPPYIAQARLVRALYRDEVAIVYVSPCWARKDEVLSPAFAGDVDAGIGFDELKVLLAENPVKLPRKPKRRSARIAKQLSVTDGFPRRTLTERDLTNGDVVITRGLRELDELLRAMSRGETSPAVVDMLNCEGCIDGPCVNRDLSVYVKRGVDVAERERQPPPAVDSRTVLSALPAIDLGRTFEAAPAPVRMPTEEEIDAVLAAGEFESRATTIDCGACGYRTCVSHAVAIWQGNSTWEMCFPLQKRRLIREREHYAEASVVDELTGLMNRRAFDTRLREEVARAVRYDTPLSLVMMDLDGFKEINDRYGHTCGDSLLRAVGVLLNSELRTADVAVRFGGDEFALVLPNTTKTDAWAVAEKVRSSLAHLTVHTEHDLSVKATVSVGIASVSEHLAHPNDLLEAADKALYRAKRAGRNRVELSPG